MKKINLRELYPNVYTTDFFVECEILRQISLPCVSTPAGIFLVLHTLLNCLDCIILWNYFRICV